MPRLLDLVRDLPAFEEAVAATLAESALAPEKTGGSENSGGVGPAGSVSRTGRAGTAGMVGPASGAGPVEVTAPSFIHPYLTAALLERGAWREAPVLLVVPDQETAEEAEHELRLYCPERPVVHLPPAGCGMARG